MRRMRGPAGSVLRLGQGGGQVQGSRGAGIDGRQQVPAERRDWLARFLPSEQKPEQRRGQRGRHLRESEQIPAGLDDPQQGGPRGRDYQHHARRGAGQFR